jgi:hypothetical protein
MKLIAIVCLILGGTSIEIAHSGDAQAVAPAPVLIELFTAEGCSSCPPADAFVVKLDSSQPISGAQLIVLSEHMDYWDQQGWADPFASAALTARQRGYVHALGLHEAYTPQLIVDGVTELRLQDRQQVVPILQKAATDPKIPVSIVAVKVESGTPATLSGRVEVNGNSVQHKADIYLGLALDHVLSKVLRGENRGQTLTHVAVLENLTKIGSLAPGQMFSQDIRVPLKPGMDPTNVRMVIFAQEPGYGRVIGAAMQRIEH